MDTVNFWLALAAAILGAASIVLHVVAPRTKTTLDDRLVAKLDELLAVLRPPAPAPTAPPAPPQPAVSIVKGTGPAALLALVALGLAAPQLSCTASQRTAVADAGKAAGHALIDCTAANGVAIGATLANMKAPKADGGCLDPATPSKPAATDWICVRGKAVGDGLTIGGCAFLELVSAEPAARVASATGEPPPERPGRAAFESYRASVAGGAAFRTAAGDR